MRTLDLALARARQIMPAALLTAALAWTSCGDDASVQPPAPTTTPTSPPPVLTIHNQTDCRLHVRFDNDRPVDAVAPNSTHEYTDGQLNDYRFLKLESTMAIFRTFDMQEIRDGGWSVTVRRAVEDGKCVDVG